VVLLFGRLAVAHRSREHRVDDLLGVINFTGRRRVGEDIGTGHRLGQQRIALHRAIEFADHEIQPLVGRPPCQGGAVGLGVDAFELPAQRGHQQVHLGGEIPVQRADCDVGTIGHRAHLNSLVAALGGDGHRRVQDALATLALCFRPELGLGKYRHVHHLTRLRAGRTRGLTRVGMGWPRNGRGHLTDSSFSCVLARNDTHAEREFLTSVPPGHRDVLLRWHST
jgi:hypothetical protein